MLEPKSQIYDEEFKNKLRSFFSSSGENRRTGRSRILARILISEAIETKDEINLIDHHLTSSYSRRNIEEFRREVNEVIGIYINEGVHLRVIWGRDGESFRLEHSVHMSNIPYFACSQYINKHTFKAKTSIPFELEDKFFKKQNKLILLLD